MILSSPQQTTMSYPPALPTAKRALEPKKPRQEAPSLGSTGWFPGGAPMPAEFLPPNNILFVENLPPETTQEILTELFQQFAGFREVRLVPTKTDIGNFSLVFFQFTWFSIRLNHVFLAFVEYDTEGQSTLAKQQLNLFKIKPDREMKVTFARK
jgi:U2 small nuclear ribonucleoprotein B''